MPAPARFALSATLATCLLAACGGGSDDDDPPPDPTGGAPSTDAGTTDPVATGGEPTEGAEAPGGRDLAADPSWRLADRFDYEADPANALSQTAGDGGPEAFGATVISTSGFGDGNGAWSGSGVGFTHSLDGDGTYAIVDPADFVRSLERSPGSPVIYFYVQAGLNAVGEAGVADSTRWGSTVGTVEAVVDEDGVYHFFADEPLPLSVQIELGTGIPDRPDDTTVTFSNVYGRPLP